MDTGNNPEVARLLEEMREHTEALAKQRKHEDPRLSFSTPEFKDFSRRFTENFKKNFGKPIEWGLIKRYPPGRKVNDNCISPEQVLGMIYSSDDRLSFEHHSGTTAIRSIINRTVTIKRKVSGVNFCEFDQPSLKGSAHNAKIFNGGEHFRNQCDHPYLHPKSFCQSTTISRAFRSTCRTMWSST